ncbi:hypothetical protein TrST_g900 [Triparma strigata]|uniref:Uncharacterized protein n=1 Tax=Triparma strigata TaxID=1606541 RepID=A0A9W7B289_9STRA|nr:hypothetical protein TrST_g900 [Triparma strigata]
MANSLMRDPRFGADEAEADGRWRSSHTGNKQVTSTRNPPNGLKSALKKKPVYVVNPWNQEATDIGGDIGSPNRSQALDRSVGHSDFGWGTEGDDEDWSEEGDDGQGWGRERMIIGVDELGLGGPEEEVEGDVEEGGEDEVGERDMPKCTCQWEWGWSRTCPVHGHKKLGDAANATSEDVYKRSVRTLNSRAKAAQFTTTNTALSGGAHKFSIQSHAGVGNATAGVRKDERGWWRDKSDYHDGDIKVKFKGGKPTNLIEEEEKEKLKFTPTDRVIGLENRMKDSLDRAKSRLESSTKKITQIETLVKSATGDLKNVAADRAQSSSDILSLKRGKLLTEARSLSSLRGERGSAETSESNENENNKGKKDTTYMPKHIRASYERDVDKLNHAFRVSGNIQREMRSAGR